MSTARGRIAVDVQFADSTTADGIQSLKTISLQDATEYTSGKVVIVTGTVGTVTQQIPLTTYRNASGGTVAFTTARRVAFQCVGATGFFVLTSLAPFSIGAISQGNLAVCDIPGQFAATSGHRIVANGGTASYTLVLYGS